MLRTLQWIVVWLAMLVWCLAIRPFVPGFLFLEPCIPLLIASLMLGPLEVVIPLLVLSGLLFDAFQPFPQPVALFALLGISTLVGLGVRFILASRSFYSALILVIVSRLLIAGLMYLLGSGAATWPAERAILTSPAFFFLTTCADAAFLLIGFRLVAKPLLGAKRVQIAR